MWKALGKLLRPFGRAVADIEAVPAHWRHIRTLLEAHGVTVLLDVGANTGQYAGWLRAAGWQGRIVSFEPLADAHAALTDKAARDPAWTIAPRAALGAVAGDATLHVSAERDMSSLRPFDPAFLASSPTSAIERDETVPVVTLAEVFADHAGAADTVFLKIDTQGYEAEVLEGAGPVMDRIAGLQVEMSFARLYDGEEMFRPLLARIEAMGFAPHLLLPGYFSKNLGRMLQFDGIFFREDAQERSK